MAGKEEKKKPQNLDDFLASLEKEHSTSMDKAFEAYDDFVKDENQLHLYNHILKPAQDCLYSTLVSSLDKEFKEKDETKLEKEEHHKKVKKAVAKALQAYFEKTHPHVVQIMTDLGMSEEDQYEHLTSQYDDHIGADPRNKDNPGIRAIVQSLIHGKKTVGHVKKAVSDKMKAAAEGALGNLNERYKHHHFDQYNKMQIAAYLKPKLEKEGFEVKEKLGYVNADLDTLLGLRRGVIEKEGHPYLTKKKEKK